MQQPSQPEQENLEGVVVGEGEVKSAQDVRQGHTGDHVRYILFISFAGAAIALALAIFAFVGLR